MYGRANGTDKCHLPGVNFDYLFPDRSSILNKALGDAGSTRIKPPPSWKWILAA